MRYAKCKETDVPAGVYFHVAPQDQGQIVEVAYGDLGPAEHIRGARYRRVTDLSVGPWAREYYVLIGSVRVGS